MKEIYLFMAKLQPPPPSTWMVLPFTPTLLRLKQRARHTMQHVINSPALYDSRQPVWCTQCMPALWISLCTFLWLWPPHTGSSSSFAGHAQSGPPRGETGPHRVSACHCQYLKSSLRFLSKSCQFSHQGFAVNYSEGFAFFFFFFHYQRQACQTERCSWIHPQFCWHCLHESARLAAPSWVPCNTENFASVDSTTVHGLGPIHLILEALWDLSYNLRPGGSDENKL